LLPDWLEFIEVERELDETTAAPLLVLVVLLTTTLVAPKAKTTDTKANGVINGGVFNGIPFSSPFLVPQIIH